MVLWASCYSGQAETQVGVVEGKLGELLYSKTNYSAM